MGKTIERDWQCTSIWFQRWRPTYRSSVYAVQSSHIDFVHEKRHMDVGGWGMEADEAHS